MEEELDRVLEAMPDPLLACDGEHRICFVNRVAARLLGWKADELVGEPFERLLPERLQRIEGVPFLEHALARMELLAGRPLRTSILRQDGLEIDVDATMGKGADRIVVVFRRIPEVPDFTAEQTEPTAAPPLARPLAYSSGAAEADRLYRIVFENAPSGILYFDKTGTITACNDALVRILGSSKALLIGLHLLTLPDSRVLDAVRATLEGESPYYEGEYVSETGGRESSLRAQFAPIRDPWNEIVGGVGIVEDVSAHRQAERERDSSFALVETLLRTAPIGLAFLDRELRYVRVNEALARINGRPREEHLGRTAAEILGAPGQAIEAVMREVLESGQPKVGIRVSDKDLGEPDGSRTFEGSIYPVLVEGVIVGVGVVVEETTERTRAEEERSRLYREAQEAIRVRDEFLSIASHELKTPLTPLSVRLATLERTARSGTPLDPRQIQKARLSLIKLTALINDLLDATRITTGRLTLHLAPMHLDELVERVATEAGSEEHAIRLELPEASLDVCGDAGRLEQVVENLLDNAAKYSPPGSPIEVCLERRGDMALLSVKDHGIGIPADQQKHLFERYFRASNAAGSRTGGLGLGLYICRDIVERHGGQVWVRSEVGKGSTFYVALPTVGAWRGLATEGETEPRPT